jgi:hypothetical protein
VRFAPKERDYIARLSGRQPFLVQLACAALFDAVAQGLSSPKRRAEVERALQHHAADHFGDVWRHLEADTRRVLLLLALAEQPTEADTSALGTLEEFKELLDRLSTGGLAEALQERQAAGANGRWRVGSAGFARWMIDHRKWQEFAPPNDEMTMTTEDRLAQIESLRARIAAKRRRLGILEEQFATYGKLAPPHITMEIENTRREIQHDQNEMQRLNI